MPGKAAPARPLEKRPHVSIALVDIGGITSDELRRRCGRRGISEGARVRCVGGESLLLALGAPAAGYVRLSPGDARHVVVRRCAGRLGAPVTSGGAPPSDAYDDSRRRLR